MLPVGAPGPNGRDFGGRQLKIDFADKPRGPGIGLGRPEVCLVPGLTFL